MAVFFLFVLNGICPPVQDQQHKKRGGNGGTQAAAAATMGQEEGPVTQGKRTLGMLRNRTRSSRVGDGGGETEGKFNVKSSQHKGK